MTVCALGAAWLEEAARLQGAGEPFVIATVVAREPPQSVRSGSKAIIGADGSVAGWVGGGCVRPTVLRESLAALRDGRPRLIRINPDAVTDAREDVKVYAMTCEGEGAVDVYLEPVLPRQELIVFGRTLVAEALARLGGALDLDVRIVDPHADPARFSGAEVLTELSAGSARIRPRSLVVVATMGEGDHEALRAALAAPCAYVGLVASRKKAATLLDHLRGEGVPEERIEAVKAPAGLDFGAVTPAEIALSILAEITQRQRTAEAPGPAEAATPAPPLEPAAAAPRAPVALPQHAPAPTGVADADALTAVDPVCGMAVEIATARHTLEHEGRTYYFCCPHCRAHFVKDPARYLAAAAAP